jgi:hypothetical protein
MQPQPRKGANVAYPRCPKCGLVATIEDECPKCGVYISKYLAVQQRRGLGGGDRPSGGTPALGVPSLGPVMLPPERGGPSPSAPSLPPLAKGSPTTRIAMWAAALLAMAGIGYVVLVDWFGAVYAYKAPPGWKKVDNEQVEKALEQMSSRGNTVKEFLALYTPGGSAQEQSAVALLELEQAVPMTESSAQMLRAGFSQLQSQMGRTLMGSASARAELTKVAGRPAIEIEFAIKMGAIDMSLLQEVIGSTRSTFVVLYLAPGAEYRANLEAVRASLSSFRVLRAEGLRGSPWVKYPLRWAWILGVLVLAFVAYGQIRNRD